MRIIFFLIVFAINSSIVRGQNEVETKSPSSFFPKEKIKVLVVGTFHFDYPNLDAKKIEAKDQIDVLKEPKKSEVTELVNYVEKFNPTKIAIEAFPDWGATEKFEKYKAGDFRDKRDERYQLGMRIAGELKLDTIFSIDAESFDADLTKLDSIYFQKLYDDFDFQSNDKYDSMYDVWYEYENTLATKMNLLDYFKRINSEDYHKLGYGVYLIGDFKLDHQRGADILSIWWYNRNLRIFRKLQEIGATFEDRILLIMGNGHASILRQLIESSPEYEFIEFSSLE